MTHQTHPKFNPQRPFDNAQGRHHRRSIRIREYDYCIGAYFVTIVTYQRDLLFGTIENGEIILNDFGNIAAECWRAIPEHFPHVELGAHVVMPNHVHGIIIINGRGTISVGATQWVAPTIPNARPNGPKRGSLGAIIGSYKMAVTRRIQHEHNATAIWQRNYYEHIIRNEKDHQRITDYIEANPLRWNDDDENPSNS
jgi:REP element-mobilizing transposase RayT